MQINEFLQRLQSVKGNGTQYTAKCPAHDDKRASLSIANGEDGRILVNCHAGCSSEAICSALGLTLKDLYAEPLQKPPQTGCKPRIVATYNYTDENGKLLAQKQRRADKTFMWRRPDGSGGWKYDRKGVKPMLYHTAEAVKADSVFLVEGEKDADTMKRLGKAAVSPPDGAGGKWKENYTQILKDKHVIIIADNDAPGRKFAIGTAGILSGEAKTVKVLDLTEIWPELPEHGDTTDIIEHFGDVEGMDKIERLATETEYFNLNSAACIEDYKGCTISISAVRAALTALGITIRYNVLLKENEITGMPEAYSGENAVNTLPVYLMDCMKAFGIKGARREVVVDYLNCIADMERFNPVEEYFNSGSWDDKDRLPEIYQILNVYEGKYQNYIKKWLIQCVALALNDEENPVGADGVLVLQGEQGLAKTSFFRILSPYPRWFVEGAVIDVSNKDTLLKALSSWITELGELDSTLKREQSALKAFITTPEDRIRPPYARNAARTPRRTSFCGTVNPKDYLRDETGSRRFWTIPIEKIDKEKLFSLPREWIHQLWFQVYKLYLQDKEGFRLTDEEMRQLQADNREFDIPLPFEEEILGIFNLSLPVNEWEWWRACDVAKIVPGYPSARQVGKVLAKFCGDVSGNSKFHINNPIHYSGQKFRRILCGNNEFLIPVLHFNAKWCSGVD